MACVGWTLQADFAVTAERRRRYLGTVTRRDPVGCQPFLPPARLRAGFELPESLRVIRRLPPNAATMVNARRYSAGRRRISLEGGNRGSEARRGVVGDGYGDLMRRLGSCVG